jgi:hypothetical protein
LKLASNRVIMNRRQEEKRHRQTTEAQKQDPYLAVHQPGDGPKPDEEP